MAPRLLRRVCVCVCVCCFVEASALAVPGRPLLGRRTKVDEQGSRSFPPVQQPKVHPWECFPREGANRHLRRAGLCAPPTRKAGKGKARAGHTAPFARRSRAARCFPSPDARRIALFVLPRYVVALEQPPGCREGNGGRPPAGHGRRGRGRGRRERRSGGRGGPSLGRRGWRGRGAAAGRRRDEQPGPLPPHPGRGRHQEGEEEEGLARVFAEGVGRACRVSVAAAAAVPGSMRHPFFKEARAEIMLPRSLRRA